MKKTLLPLLVMLCLFSCTQKESIVYKSIEKHLQAQFISAADSSVIDIPEGHFIFKGSLSLEGKKNIIIRGKGKDKTFLSFKGQTEGAEGIKMTNCANITIQDLDVQDTKGDAIKTQDIKGITFRNVIAEWTGEVTEHNGSYGLYPVNCDSVLVDGCASIGASDAGIYVGQSRQVVVRNCNPTHNVAGIEIENCQHAEVYDNYVTENAGGILVFDMPGLKQSGHDVRVYHNKVVENNFKNFAPKGNIVGTVPSGTGVMVVATKRVEILNNEMEGNKTVSVAIASYMMSGFKYTDTTYDPYPKAVNIHDNIIHHGFRLPTLANRMGKLLAAKFLFWPPDILYDGIVDPKALDANGKVKDDLRICVKNNGNVKIANLDAPDNFKHIDEDPGQFDCDKPQLAKNAFDPK